MPVIEQLGLIMALIVVAYLGPWPLQPAELANSPDPVAVR